MNLKKRIRKSWMYKLNQRYNLQHSIRKEMRDIVNDYPERVFIHGQEIRFYKHDSNTLVYYLSPMSVMKNERNLTPYVSEKFLLGTFHEMLNSKELMDIFKKSDVKSK